MLRQEGLPKMKLPNVLRLSYFLVSWISAFCTLPGNVFGETAKPLVLDVDQVWTGTNSQFASLSIGNDAFVAYYNAQRELTVAHINLESGRIDRKDLHEKIPGWDSHDETKLALDASKLLHVVFINHARPLEYFRSNSELSIGDLNRVGMTSLNEDRVTYPSFLRLGDNLLFVFRDGVSGDGAWYANALIDHVWKRVSRVFANRMGAVPVSAYPSAFVKAADNSINVAIVWRKTPDVNSNFRVTFAKTKDFVSWTNADGVPLVAPLSPIGRDLVDDVGEGNGLVNNAQLSVTTDGVPLIAYTKYDEAGKNAVYLAYPRSGWKILKVAAAKGRVPIEGRGSLPKLPAFSRPVVHGAGDIHLAFSNEPAFDATFDAKSAKLGGTKQEDLPRFSFPAVSTDGLAEPVTLTSVAEPYDPHYYDVIFRWATQGPHSDIPRACKPVEPQACSPPPTHLMAYIFKK
jgi:BNR repeat-containing family member